MQQALQHVVRWSCGAVSFSHVVLQHRGGCARAAANAVLQQPTGQAIQAAEQCVVWLFLCRQVCCVLYLLWWLWWCLLPLLAYGAC